MGVLKRDWPLPPLNGLLSRSTTPSHIFIRHARQANARNCSIIEELIIIIKLVTPASYPLYNSSLW
jgi:hypothetical protein